MSIQFECMSCGSTIEVPDDSVGQKAKCPACYNVMEVPTVQIPDPEPFDNSQDPVNPYASTSTIDSLDSGALQPSTEISVRQIDVGWTLTATWELYKVHFGVLIGFFLITFLVSFFSQLGFNLLDLLADVMTAELGEEMQFAVKVPLSVVGFILIQLVNVWFSIATIRFLLLVARNQPADFSLLLKSGPYFIRTAIATLLFVVVFYGGLILLIIPGVYFGLTYWNFAFFIVDRNCGIMESFKLCRIHAEGNRMSILVLVLIFMGLGTLGCLALCLGWIVTTPFSVFMFAIAYLTMTGQPFVQPRVPANV